MPSLKSHNSSKVPIIGEGYYRHVFKFYFSKRMANITVPITFIQIIFIRKIVIILANTEFLHRSLQFINIQRVSFVWWIQEWLNLIMGATRRGGAKLGALPPPFHENREHILFFLQKRGLLATFFYSKGAFLPCGGLSATFFPYNGGGGGVVLLFLICAGPFWGLPPPHLSLYKNCSAPMNLLSICSSISPLIPCTIMGASPGKSKHFFTIRAAPLLLFSLWRAFFSMWGLFVPYGGPFLHVGAVLLATFFSMWGPFFILMGSLFWACPPPPPLRKFLRATMYSTICLIVYVASAI